MTRTRLLLLSVAVALPALGRNLAFAHCDGMDGPVVKAAQKAIEKGDVNLVLVWVQKKDEEEIRKAFGQTLAMRKLSPQAKEFADLYFFETLVRVHRLGEGAPYTGLKPAGRDLGPAIPAVDKSLEDGDVEPLVKLLTGRIEEGIRERFKHVRRAKEFKTDDVEAGREFVKAYVEYLHYAERLYQDAKGPAHGHFREDETEADGGHKPR